MYIKYALRVIALKKYYFAKTFSEKERIFFFKNDG